MKTILVLSCLATFALSQPASAQDFTPPSVIAQGFVALQKNGPLAALDAWLVGSARELDNNFQDQVTARLNRAQGYFGHVLGYETIRVVNLTPSTQRVYVAVKYEKSVAWMSFDCCRPDKEWIVARFDFETNANSILPPSILGGQ